MEFTCPRCTSIVEARFYGPCDDCRAQLREAFRRFLVPGKPGYVPHQWASLADAVGWILAAGGQAVLAHPGRYGLSAGAMEALLNEFRAAGGEALEVVTGSHSPMFIALSRSSS